jgi:hypothetical protein
MGRGTQNTLEKNPEFFAYWWRIVLKGLPSVKVWKVLYLNDADGGGSLQLMKSPSVQGGAFKYKEQTP